MDETLRELNRIANKNYHKDYDDLCNDRKSIVRDLYATENL